MGSILLVDDDPSFRAVLQSVMDGKGNQVTGCGSVQEGLAQLETTAFDLVVSDIKMEPVDGMALLKNLRALCPDVPVVMMTAYASVETALDALKMGAFDYITKPFKLDEFLEVVDRALGGGKDAQGAAEMLKKVDEHCVFGRVVSVNDAMRETCRMIELVAPTEATVLLCGEPGSGRSLIAHVIHEMSLRKENTCVTIDCGKLPQAEPEKAFIGRAAQAEEKRESAGRADGLLVASGGTVVLEDVEKLPPSVQQLLLEVLSEKTVTRPGAKRGSSVDVRVLATADSGLHQAAADGRLLEDLFKRLSLVSIPLRPLRERHEDILPLSWYFLREEAGDNDQVPEMSADVRGTLQHYSWPGNVAELRAVIKHAYGHSVEGAIVRESLPPHMLRTLTESLTVFSTADMSGTHAASLRAFLQKKGVDLTSEMAKKELGSPTGNGTESG